MKKKLFGGLLFVALGYALFAEIASGNYTATQGVGTTFGSAVVSTVHYVQMLLCDPTTPTQCGAVDSSGSLKVSNQPLAATTGGVSVYNVQPGASDNHANIKNGAGQVYKISVTNNSANVNYIRLYDAGTGFNGCNSATGIKYSNAIPASTSIGGILDQWDVGMSFSTGISICVSSGYAQTDTTAATASAMNVNIGYK